VARDGSVEKENKMANWVPVPNSNGIWEYDSDAESTDSYKDANGTTVDGIRTFTWPDGKTEEIYIKCKKVGEEIERGELSKTYYDAQG